MYGDEVMLIYLTGRFLGEETYAKGQSRDYLIDKQPTWCIDPLDGNIIPEHSKRKDKC